MQTFPQRLHHNTPAWVADTAIFHIRIRLEKHSPEALTVPKLAARLLDSVRIYTDRGNWSCFLFLLMPDHLHALISFGHIRGMKLTIADWKGFHARKSKVCWQENFFDHRIRNSTELAEKYAYIAMNPVALGLCALPEDWPWRIAAFPDGNVPNL